MRQICCSSHRLRFSLLLGVFVLFPLLDCFALDFAKLNDDLGSYRTDVVAVARKAAESEPPNQLLITYLADNQAAAEGLLAFIGSAKQELPVVRELEGFNRKRLITKEKLLLLIKPGVPDFALLREENQSWTKHLQPYLADVYVRDLVVRKQLYEHKYFEDDDPGKANMVEAWVNGALPFTRYRDEAAWYRQRGVSAWEASTRVEPLVLLENSNHPGVLATLGMLYNFLPEVTSSPENRLQAQVKEDFWSKNVKRAGLKLGAGTLFDDPKTEFLAGLGLQLRAWSLWGVYSTGQSRYSLAVSLSDWGWLKKVVPLFP